VVHACQQLLPGTMIVGAPTPAIPKPGPQGPGFSYGCAISAAFNDSIFSIIAARG